MFVHVALKAKIAGREGILTYQVDKGEVGQLVLVRLRGRRVPGVITAVNVPAGTSQAILPVLATSHKSVPASWLSWLESVAAWYHLPLSPTLAQLAPQLNATYLGETRPSGQPGAQKLYLSPADHTPLAAYLHQQRVATVPDAAGNRRQQWWQAAEGSALQVLGTFSAATLPYKSLSQIILETPLASPYYHDRSPGFHTAVLAALLAQATGAELTVRSVLPVETLRLRLPLPAATTHQAPPLHPLTCLPLGARSAVNQDLAGSIASDLKAGKRVLVFHNHLPTVDPTTGRVYGLQQLATELSRRLARSVPVLTAQQAAADEPICVATATTLFRHHRPFDAVYVPLADSLISPQQPWSPLGAVEMLGILASRAPLTLQLRDQEGILAAALRGNLKPEYLSTLTWPKFTHRLLRFRPDSLDHPLPPSPPELTTLPSHPAEMMWLAPRDLSLSHQEWLAALREQGKLWTDEWTWSA